MTQPNQSEHMTQEELAKFMLNPATIDRAAKGMIERKRAKIMDDQSKPAKDIDVTRRPVDQSELRADIHSLFGDYHTVDGGYFSSYDGKWIDMTNEVVAVADYITANYTPNSRLKALLKESEKWNGRIQGTSNCKSCALQESLAGLIKDKL